MKCILEDQLKKIEEIINEIRKICSECYEAQCEYEKTLIQEGRKAVAMAKDEAEYWKSKYYRQDR